MPSIPLPSLLPACLLCTALLAGLLMPGGPVRAQDVATDAKVAAHAADDAAAASAAASAGVQAAGVARGRHADARVQREQQRSQAQAALHRQHPAQALAIAEEALAQAPGDARLRFLKGVALNQLGRPDEAEDVFRALVDEYPELPEPYNNLAVVLAAQGRLEDARLALEEAIQAVPNHAIAHENLGSLYLQLARRNWQRAHELAPASKTLARRLKALDAIDMAPPTISDTPTRAQPAADASSPRSPDASSSVEAGESAAGPAQPDSAVRSGRVTSRTGTAASPAGVRTSRPDAPTSPDTPTAP